MIHRIEPPIWVTTPLGEGDALFLLDYGVNLNSVWLVHLHQDGKVKHFDSDDIRVMGNLMYGIPHPSPAQAPGSPYSTPDHPV
jgi:hypothetical protein